MTTTNQEKEIDTFVRDVCSVIPKSKSEVKATISKLVSQAIQERDNEMIKMIEDNQAKGYEANTIVSDLLAKLKVRKMLAK
jgi:ferritin